MPPSLQEPFDVLWRGPIAAWLVACTLLAAHVLARRIEPEARLLERWVATATAGMWLATLGFHVLAPLHALSLWWAVPGASVLGVLSLALERDAPAALGRDARALSRICRRALRGRERWWVLALAVCALPVLGRPLIAPPLGWDALTQHAFEAGVWAQQGGLVAFDAPGPWFAHNARWLGSSILTSWAMLPFHSDLLATFAQAIQWLLLGLTLTALGRALGVEEPLASSAAAFVLALPTLRLLVGAGYAEPAACLALAAACMFAVRHVRTRRGGYLVLALGALGLAVQMKQSFLRSCVALGVALVVSAMWRAPR